MKLSEMFAHWEQVRRELLATIDKFSDEELTYTPYVGAWPVGQIMLHIADCEDNWLHAIVRQEFTPWIFYDLKVYPSKAAIKEVLQRAHQRTLPFLASLDESALDQEYTIPNDHAFSLGWIIWHVLEHEIHHRGELSLILGLLGREGLDV
ncbi:MAG: DinB family protein [Caldilineaceae bacterium]